MDVLPTNSPGPARATRQGTTLGQAVQSMAHHPDYLLRGEMRCTLYDEGLRADRQVASFLLLMPIFAAPWEALFAFGRSFYVA
jgi:hypothetical protein